jgi:hypothetical protein
LKKCSKCKLVAYCNYDCQLKHWKAGHKLVCVAINEAPEQGASPIAAEVRNTLNPSQKLQTPNEENQCFGLLDKNSKKSMVSAEEECANCAAVGGRGNTVLSKCSKCSMVAYCSRACQLQHWKDGGHKLFCISPSERSPSTHALKKKDEMPSEALDVNCVICDDKIDASTACALPCGHRFHAACMVNMRQFGVSQVCPLCRAPLPPRPDNSFEFARREYTAVARQVMHSGGSWSTLSCSDELRVTEVVRCMRAAADQGHPGAQTLLGDLYLRGEGVAQNEIEGVKWYRKAAKQGHATAQRKLDAIHAGGQRPSNHEAKVNR